ncbi:VOC family protein [Pendulispora albinea]|uniref:VOC family protein n=1 Tax=Pendulispora albinea TaxID=2741071 RepID=A0ABZ2LL75_9BACT
MANELNHIIVHCHDRHATARFLSELLGAEPPLDWGPFTQVTSSNRVGIDFASGMIPPAAINMSHLAFLVTDAEFDAIFARISERSLRYWADPMMRHEGKINHNYGGRGVYLLDPGKTVSIEFITRPYGAAP